MTTPIEKCSLWCDPQDGLDESSEAAAGLAEVMLACVPAGTVFSSPQLLVLGQDPRAVLAVPGGR